MALPSWEEIVNRVTIESNYYNVGDAAEGWRTTFRQLDDLHDKLKTLHDNSSSWKGGAGDAFRKQIKTHMDNVKKLADDHRTMVQSLESCRDHLETAVGSIEIPTWMYGEVQQKQNAYHQGQEISGYSEGSFANGYLQYVMGDGFGGSWNPLKDVWRTVDGWIRDREGNAQKAYQQLCNNYANDHATMPEPSQITPPPVQNPKDFNPTGPSGPGSKGFTPGGGPMPSGAKLPPPGSGGFHPPGAGGIDPSGSLPSPGSSGLDPSGSPSPHLGSGGLAGAVPGGLSGLHGGGLGGGGLGGGLGSAGGLGAGAGLGGLGGRGLPPIGPSVAPGGMLGGLGGAGAGAGRGGGRGSGSGGARSGGRQGMMGGGHGAHGGGDGDDRGTWLMEDEDVWGGGNDAPPRVIGG